MASGGPWVLDLCPECGKRVEILNGDVQFSIEVHMQSHKSFETIDQEIDRRLQTKKAQGGINNKKKVNSNYICPDCGENVELVNNDVSFSLRLHSQKHKHGSVDRYPEDQLSTCSSKSKSSEKKGSNSSNKLQCPPSQTSILDGIFNTMQPGLKSHRAFITEHDSGKAFCNVCNQKVESMFSVSEHLKTKLHEDNTITFFKTQLPLDLHQMMEFVSFYGSNLCCNLCRCKIDLCSSNPYETIVNVMAHNAGKSHLKKNTNSEPSNQSNEALIILKSLAQINPLINDNKNFIDFKMQPQFKCNLCDKNIAYDQNENGLLKNFVSHLNSASHNKCLKAISIFNSFQQYCAAGKCKHSFVLLKDKIFCKVCNNNVEVNLEQLVLHRGGQNCIVTNNSSSGLASDLYNLSMNSTYSDSPISEKNSIENISIKSPYQTEGGIVSQESASKRLLGIRDLLNSLPRQFNNITYVVANDQGQATCLICDCTIPATTYNLQTHLTGKSHQIKEQAKYAAAANINTNVTSNTLVNRSGEASNIPINRLGEEITNDKRIPTVKELFEMIHPHLQNSIGYITASRNGKNEVRCSPCNVTISAHWRCLQEHLMGSSHKTSVSNLHGSGQENKNIQKADESNLLNKLIKSDSIIKNFSKYLIARNDDYICKLCNATLKKSMDEQLLKDNLLSHATGKNHKKNLSKVFNELFNKVQSLDPVIKSNKDILKNQQTHFFCTLCECSVSTSTDEENFRKNIVSHLTGSKHVNNKEGLNQRASAPYPMMAGNVNTKDPIKELFERLPLKFLEDSTYIKSSSIEGYVACTLCNRIINPHYLREHLEDEKHIMEKSCLRGNNIGGWKVN